MIFSNHKFTSYANQFKITTTGSKLLLQSTYCYKISMFLHCPEIFETIHQLIIQVSFNTAPQWVSKKREKISFKTSIFHRLQSRQKKDWKMNCFYLHYSRIANCWVVKYELILNSVWFLFYFIFWRIWQCL